MKKSFCFLFFCMILGSLCFAQFAMPEPVPPSVISPRINGLGACFTADQSERDRLFTNPAVFPFLTKKWSFGKIALHANEDSFGGISALTASEKIKAFTNQLYKNNKTFFDFNATGPIAFSFADKNFAVGLFNRSILHADVEASIMKKLLIGEELFLTGGYGICLYDDTVNKVSLGFQMKGFFQTFSYALNKNKVYMASAANSAFKDLNIVLVNAVGLDAGFLYKCEDYFILGITCRDAYTPVFLTPYNNFDDYKKARPAGKTQYKTLLPNLSIGIGSIPVGKDLWPMVSSWSFYLDYQNLLLPILNKNKSPFLNIAFGTEIIFHEVLSFTLGMTECYPHFGCGLNFTYFQIDFSAFLKELGNKPWEQPKLGIDFSLSFEY